MNEQIPDPIDDGLCAAEFPGDDLGFVGQLCEESAGHDGEHRSDVPLGGRYVRALTWKS